MRALLTAGLVLALSACGDGAEPGNNMVVQKPVPGPRLGGVDLDKPVRASGIGPYWQIEIAPGTIAYAAAPNAASTSFYPVTPRLAGNGAVYATQTPEGAPVTITLTAKACSAGGASLPLAAEARIGTRTLRGCAGSAPIERRPPPQEDKSSNAM
jgi:uncharacterized membrane protein